MGQGLSRSIVDSTNPMPSPSLPATSSIGMIALDGWGQAGGTSGRTKQQGSPVANLYVYCFEQQAILAVVCLYVLRTYKRDLEEQELRSSLGTIMPFCRVLLICGVAGLLVAARSIYGMEGSMPLFALV